MDGGGLRPPRTSNSTGEVLAMFTGSLKLAAVSLLAAGLTACAHGASFEPETGMDDGDPSVSIAFPGEQATVAGDDSAPGSDPTSPSGPITSYPAGAIAT